MYNYTFKRQRIVYDNGMRKWDVREDKAQFPASETAFIIVDMWDTHWCEGAARRCSVLADKINETAIRAREKGILIVHAPSDTMKFYEQDEARKRFLSLDIPSQIPDTALILDYPQPVDSSDGGSDTSDSYPSNTIVWKRQTEKIFIDQSRDLVMGNEGDRLYAHLISRGIKFLIYAGVHTNMCILNRTFAIKKMLRRGFKTALVRDLTDAMYNPERVPYVSHEEGTALIIAYIEKFYCPTISSGQI